jgi:hypothetical protein
MSNPKILEQSSRQPADPASSEHPAAETLRKESTLGASQPTIKVNVPALTGEAMDYPWDFDENSAAGRITIRDRYLEKFYAAMEHFYRNFSSDSGYGHAKYSVIQFNSAQSMAQFVGGLRQMRLIGVDQCRTDAKLHVDLSLNGNSAHIVDRQWQSDQMKKALKANHISCTVAVYHNFTLEFRNHQEARHFLADCGWHQVTFGRGGTLALPKFSLGSLQPAVSTTVEDISYDAAGCDWSLNREYDGCAFRLGPFSCREEALAASFQFDYLIALIPAAMGSESKNTQ